MATGDITNNIRRLRSRLKEIKYPEECDVRILAEGLPTAYLPIYHYTFTSFSPAISQLILEKGIELYGKSDARFMEAIYKVLRDVFSYKPPINKEQFFSKGFAERKIIMCTEILELVKDRHDQLKPGRSKTSLKTSVRPKSAIETRNLPLAVPKTKSVDSVRISQQDGSKVTVQTSGPQVVNELIVAPAAEPVRHLSTSFNSSNITRHIAAQGGINVSQSSDESVPARPPAIVTQHAAMLRSENRPVKHVSIQSPRDFQYISRVARLKSPEESFQNSDRITSPEVYRFTSPEQTNGNKNWVFDESTPVSFERVRSHYMTPGIKKVYPSLLEVVSIPRGQADEQPSILDIQAPTSDSVLHAPVPASHSDLASLTQTVESFKVQVLSQMENLTARILLLENRMSILEAKFVEKPVTLTSTQSATDVVSSKNLELSHNSQALFQGPGTSFAEELKSLKGSQMAQSLGKSTDFSLNYSPIRKETNGIVGSVMSANEDTFALETEDDVRRASTPTMGRALCDTTLQCNISHVETKDAVTRINNMIKETAKLMKPSKPN